MKCSGYVFWVCHKDTCMFASHPCIKQLSSKMQLQSALPMQLSSQCAPYLYKDATIFLHIKSYICMDSKYIRYCRGYCLLQGGLCIEVLLEHKHFSSYGSCRGQISWWWNQVYLHLELYEHSGTPYGMNVIRPTYQNKCINTKF